MNGDTPGVLAPSAFAGFAGHLVTGVAVVVALVDGEPIATTAGSVAAASWEPPLLAIFFRSGSRMAAALNHSPRFTVNLLGEADHGLARRFARTDREQGWSSLVDVPLLRRDPSPPVLANAIAWAECATAQTIPIGDHFCYAGEVVGLHRDGAAPPLTYHRGRFRTLGPAIAPAPWAMLEPTDLSAIW